MFQTEVVEKIITKILCSVAFFGKGAMYEVKQKNIVEPASHR
jgi:hypothetical protein